VRIWRLQGESASWHGVVPDSFRQFRQRQPDAELQLHPNASWEQIEAVRAGRLDAGFVFSMPKSDRQLDQVTVATHHLLLAAPKGHPLTRLKRLRLRDTNDTAFVWFPRRQSRAYYDRLMHECFRGGLKRRISSRKAWIRQLCLAWCRAGLGWRSLATLHVGDVRRASSCCRYQI